MHDRRAGRGRAARVRAEVRDGLSPQSAADGDHAPVGRHVPERQRRVPEDDRLRPRRRGRQDHRRARASGPPSSATRSSRPLRSARPPALEIPYRTKDGRALTLAIVSARIDFGGEPLPDQRRDRRDRAPRDRGRVATERGAGPRARRRARGADGRRARRGVDRAGSATAARCAAIGRGASCCASTEGQNLSKTADDPTATRALQGVRERAWRFRPTISRCSGRRAASRCETTRRRSASTTGRWSTCTAARSRCAIRAARRADRSAPSST